MNAVSPITAADPMRDELFGVDIDPWDAPGWREAANEYRKARGKNVSVVSLAPEGIARLRRLMDDGVSHERAWFELGRGRPTPEVTIQAIVFAVRERGMAALKKPATTRRLSHCNAAAITEIGKRIGRK